MPNYSPLFAGFPQPLSMSVIQANGLGASLPNSSTSNFLPTAGLYLINQAKADNIGVQISPPVIWEGSGLNSTNNAPQITSFRAYLQPVNAATNPTANWLLQSSINQGTFTNALTISSGGNLTVPGVISASQLTTAVSGGTWVIGNNGVVSVSGNGSTNKVSITGGNAQLNVGTDNIANQINGSGTFTVNKNATQYFIVTNGGLVGIGATTPTSTFNNGGSFAYTYIAKTANYSVTVSDCFIDCTSNSFTITLPTAVSITGRLYIIKNSGTATTITIATTSSQTIDGTTPTPLTTAVPLRVISDGANWKTC